MKEGKGKDGEGKACGTHCQSIYGSATVSDSLNGC